LNKIAQQFATSCVGTTWRNQVLLLVLERKQSTRTPTRKKAWLAELNLVLVVAHISQLDHEAPIKMFRDIVGF
jgi:hypothetical protein